MQSAFGVEHGFAKMYTEHRPATSEDLAHGEWMTGKTNPKPPGKLKRKLMPKSAAKQQERSQRKVYASRYNDMLPGDRTNLSRGKFGPGPEVKEFSRHVPQYDPKGKRSY